VGAGGLTKLAQCHDRLRDEVGGGIPVGGDAERPDQLIDSELSITQATRSVDEFSDVSDGLVGSPDGDEVPDPQPQRTQMRRRFNSSSGR
jgi:hypothetical protein